MLQRYWWLDYTPERILLSTRLGSVTWSEEGLVLSVEAVWVEDLSFPPATVWVSY